MRLNVQNAQWRPIMVGTLRPLEGAVTTAETTAELAALLLRSRNPDGGWAYYAGKTSRLEPTCWALLALKRPAAADIAVDALRNWPARDGLLLERRDGEPNYAFHGLALLTLQACGVEHAAGNGALIAGMQRARGLTFERSPFFRQDNSLVGWSWIEGTFGWVEPTAWCLLALKKVLLAPGAQVDRSRIDQAERLLVDRTCQPGGWNYGNSNALGQELPPYVATTAIALLAMQDRRDDPAVQRSLAYLEDQATTERSGVSLALAIEALRVYERPGEGVTTALMQQLPVTLALANQAALATALHALRTDHAHAAFTL